MTSTLLQNINTALGTVDVIMIVPGVGLISAYIADNDNVMVQVDKTEDVIPAIKRAAEEHFTKYKKSPKG